MGLASTEGHRCLLALLAVHLFGSACNVHIFEPIPVGRGCSHVSGTFWSGRLSSQWPTHRCDADVSSRPVVLRAIPLCIHPMSMFHQCSMQCLGAIDSGT